MTSRAPDAVQPKAQPLPTAGPEGGRAYYNECDPFAAAWLRELIARGLIAPGDVDERDIRDVRPDELSGYAQCHFFAGIGGWSYALRLAGWPDDAPIWTGSCPCQPFSAAGGRAGFADERHLWPAFFHLIEQCGPVVVAGEQVAGGNVDPWFDLVQADLEGVGYAFGLCPAPSAGFGAPHIRDRAFWLAYAVSDGRGQLGHGLDRATRAHQGAARQWERLRADLADGRAVGGVDIPAGFGREWFGHQPAYGVAMSPGPILGGLADALRGGAEHGSCQGLGAQAAIDSLDGGVSRERLWPWIQGPSGGPGPTGGFWRDADWLGCTDGKWRPVEPGTFPLAHGLPARVGRLRGYGNAINPHQAAAFVGAFVDHLLASERRAA